MKPLDPENRNLMSSEAMLVLNGENLTTSDVWEASKNYKLQISIESESQKKIIESHKLLNNLIQNNRIVYGVNTGVGGFVSWIVPEGQSEMLQENLISGVATNVGSYLDDSVSRAAMLIRLNSFARGTSAISLDNFNILLSIYNAGIAPCIPSKGSLGASGDLGPLACIALVCIGKWKARYQGKIVSGKEALERAGISPMKLGFKEGLSLVNGTSVMTALAAILVEKAALLVRTYDIISSLTFEALKAKKNPFNPLAHFQKPHRGQQQTAQNIWDLLEDSQMIITEQSAEKNLQSFKCDISVHTGTPIEDAYSIRCTPHIIGPIRDAIVWITSIINNEINSSNDNPLAIPGHKEVFHNGHFHGQYISMAMDYLSICMTTLSNLSDRRIDRFMDHSHSNNLPPFLCKESPGLRLGLMGGQFMATSLTAENRSLCNPVSTQSLPSTGDFQDIVSMGLIAARRANEIYENAVYILSFELLCGAQAVDIRGKKHLGSASKTAHKIVRKIIPYLSEDVSLTEHLEKLSSLIKSNKILFDVQKILNKIIPL